MAGKKKIQRSTVAHRRPKGTVPGSPRGIATYTYLSHAEREKLEFVVNLKGVSISSFVADAVLDRIHEELRIYERAQRGRES